MKTKAAARGATHSIWMTGSVISGARKPPCKSLLDTFSSCSLSRLANDGGTLWLKLLKLRILQGAEFVSFVERFARICHASVLFSYPEQVEASVHKDFFQLGRQRRDALVGVVEAQI